MRLPSLIFGFFLLLLFSCSSFAWDSSSAYNTIAMSYTANTTITQIINLNSTQKAATTINFEVDVKNGGGRPTQDLNGVAQAYSGQTDSATITIYRYNSAGVLLGTSVSQTYILQNYGSNAGWSNAPGDNLHPFTQASISYSGSLADTAYIKIEMKGTDGAWWAGNYGPQWRTPTVTVGASTTNIAYNSEFGVAPNGVQAQGWTPSYGSWAACGVTSGNSTCVTQQSGVTANMWGGGYDQYGGTTSGASGGYSGTLTSDNATQAASGTITPTSSTPTPQPTPIYFDNSTVKITNIWPTSNNSPAGEGAANAFDNNPNTKYLNFDKLNAGVTVKLNTGRVVNGFTITTANDFSGRDPTSYKLYGSNDGVNWVLIQEGNLSLTDSRLTTSSMINVTNSSAYVYYYIFFPSTKAGTGCGLDCDSMQISEITYYYDANNSTTSSATGGTTTPVDPVQAAAAPTIQGGTITQSGAPSNQTLQSGTSFTNNNDRTAQNSRISTWANTAQTYNNAVHVTQIGGDNNIVNINLSGSKNRTELTLDGAGTNTIGITQVGSNYLKADVNGYNNSLTSSQTNTIGTNYTETTISGNNNIVNHTQSNNNNRLLFSTVNGDNNTLTTTQSGAGQHYLDVRMTGNGHNVLVNQYGSGGNNARIDVTNAGGAATVDVEQSGGKSFTLIQSCTNPAGCNTVIRQ